MRISGLALVAACVLALPCAAADVRPRTPHLRSTDREALRTVREGMRRSPTFRRLVEAIEGSDVLVYIEPTHEMPPGADAFMRWFGANVLFRAVRIGVRIPVSTDRFLALLGHEMQHVTEVAAEPMVRDDRSLDALYRRIGFDSGAGWETRAARATGELVLQELRAGPKNAL